MIVFTVWAARQPRIVQMTAQGGQPIELIRYNADTSKFEIEPRAQEILRSVKGPLAVVAVSGRARQGKSFILNQLLQVSGGFTVGSTHRPCTKGVHMWSHPLKREAEDGSAYHLVRGCRAADGATRPRLGWPSAQAKHAHTLAHVHRCCWTPRVSTPMIRCASIGVEGRHSGLHPQ